MRWLQSHLTVHKSKEIFMKKEDVLKRLDPLLDSAIELAESDDVDKLIGTIVRLNSKMAKNDVDAFVELAMISILMDEKGKK